MQPQSRNPELLRRALQADSAFSLLGGTILVLAAGPVANLLGLQQASILTGIGLALWLYAAALFLNARRSIINRAQAVVAVVLNFGWVVGSAWVVAWGVLTTIGNWMVAIVADVVLLLGILQAYGLRKLAAPK